MAMFSENENEYGELQNLLPIFTKIQNYLKFSRPKKLFIINIKFIFSIQSLNTTQASAAGRRRPTAGLHRHKPVSGDTSQRPPRADRLISSN